MGKWLRDNSLTIHRWLGLHLAIYFMLLLLSGSLLMVVKEIAAFRTPEFFVSAGASAQDASFAKVYENLMADEPGRRVFVLQKEATPWLAGEAFVRNAEDVSEVIRFNRYTGEIVGEGQAGRFVAILEGFHTNLLIPFRIISILINSSALIMIASVVTGLVAYRRFWKGWLRWPSRELPSRSRLGGLHRIFALWSAPFLLVISLTALVFLAEGLGANLEPHAEKLQSERADVIPATFDATVIARAEEEVARIFPDFRSFVMIMPRTPEEGLVFMGWMDGKWLNTLGSEVSIDPETMQVLHAFKINEQNLSARLPNIARELHYGSWGGKSTRLLWFAFGMASVVAMIIGTSIFAARTFGRNQTGGWIKRAWLGMGYWRWLYWLGFTVLAIRIAMIIA